MRLYSSPMDADENPIYTDVTGVILAGGRSRRMGRDKALIEVGGVPVFERVVEVFRRCFARNLIAGDRPDLARPDLPCFADRFPGSALGGLFTGLAAAETPYVFATACDLPFIGTEAIRAVADRRQGWDAVVPSPPTGPEPLFALYGKTCLPVMDTCLQRGHYRILDIYPELKVHFLGEEELPPGWRKSLCNINTPEDLRKAQTLTGNKS